ncbi:MAG: transglycosylase domain-containing protein [Oscillospiraceae bacterium]|nr:transglycosylase domain-containing protein [Oscillospiraceae bacterium]
MANENKKRRTKKPRQEWNPHWLLKVIYALWTMVLSVFKIAIGAALTVVLIALVCGVIFVGTLGDYLQEDILTEAADWSIGDYDIEETSFAYYVDGDGKIQLLQQITTTIDRQWAELEDIPQSLIDATVAIEDKRFYEHQGVDWITTVKACINMFFGSDSNFGGSTITQQLVKNVTQEKSVTVQRKVMEIFRAQIFEREYDKDLILEEYLNRIYLGKGCYGVKSAAAEYFGKELQSLTVAECASLISITNNPSLFNPYSETVYKYKGEERTGREWNRWRQLNVLSEMYNQGYLTELQYAEAVAQEMVFKSGIADEDKWSVCENASCGYEGTVSTFTAGEGGNYYCPQCGSLTSVSTDASQEVYSWFVDAVLIDVARKLAEKDGITEWNDTIKQEYLARIQTGGYHIYTTLDMDIQNAVDAVYNDLSKIPTTTSAQQLQSSIVIIDDRTGDVVALAGGVGEKTDFLGYNKATQAKLQTGSAQKPISVYAPAFESGAASPATVVKDMPVNYYNGAWPKNDNRRYDYSRTIYSGVVSSVNTIAVRTLGLAGEDYAFNFAKYNLGLSNLTDRYVAADGSIKSDIGQSPLALGALTVGATVQEMATAYATFANDGVYRESRLFTKVYDSNGRIVLDNTQDSKKVLSDKTVNYINYCLYHAANHGTGGAAVFGGQNIAGKTGTTSSNKDRWFCGYTGHYTAAVWCGFNRPEQIYLTGNTANPAARLWRMVMQPIHQGLPSKGLFDGNIFQTVGVCLDSGLIATAACKSDARGLDRVSYAACYPEDRPQGTCGKHISMEYCVTGGGVATEYCELFARHEDVEIEARSLVKLSREEVEEIKLARRYGLNEIYYQDGYVYYLDGSWHGFDGNLNPDSDLPYLTCTVHTKEAWEEYEVEDEEGDDEGIVDGGEQPGNGDEEPGNGDGNYGGGGNNEGLIGGGGGLGGWFN